MATQSVSTLKGYFNTGDQPTESQFADLIESNLNLTDGGTISGTTTMTGALNAQNATNYLGLHKFQGFVGDLATTNGATQQYADNDILIELGTLDTTVPSGFVTATKFFFSEFIIGITTAAGTTLLGNLAVGTASGEATNGALTNPTEVVGADVTSFHNQLSATQGITEIDINFNNTAGNYHVFAPYVTAAIARKFLYARTTTTLNTNTAQQGEFTVAARYSVF